LLLYVAWKSWREFAHAPPPPRGGAPAKLGGGGFGVFIAGF
jgi:hypothetical protein